MKKYISLFLCVLISVGALHIPVFAADTETIRIETAADLRQLAENCVLDTWSRDKTVFLTADLDLAGGEFYGIPLFMGRFDGNGHTISGLDISGDASVTGLFRQVLAGGVVENLTVTGSVTPGGTAKTIGGIAGENHGEIRNCAFEGAVKGTRCVGGIAGSNGPTGVIESCSVKGTAEGAHRVGGIAGESSGSIYFSTNFADVNTELSGSVAPEELDLTLSAEELIDITDVGGIAGFSSGTVRGCVNEGSVGYPQVGYNIGGIAGHQSGLTADCQNNGAVRGRRDVGGIVGQLDPDAKWKVSGDSIGELREKLDELHRRIKTLIDDAGEEKNAVSSEISAVLDALEHTGEAVDALSDEVTGWVNDNLETVNDIGSRISTVIDGLLPVTGTLTDFTNFLSLAVGRFVFACRALSDAAGSAQPGMQSLSDALEHLEGAMQGGQTAAGNIVEGADHLQRGLGDPGSVQTALTYLSDGLYELAYAVRSLSDGIRATDNALAEIIDEYENRRPLPDEPGEEPGDGSGEEPGWTDHIRLPEHPLEDIRAGLDMMHGLTDSLQTALPMLADRLMSAGDAFPDIISAVAELVGQPRPEELSSSLTSLKNTFAGMADMLSDLGKASRDLRGAASAAGEAGTDISSAFEYIADASEYMEYAFSALGQTGEGVMDLLEDLSGSPSISFVPIDRESAAREELVGSLAEIGSAMDRLTGEMDDTQLLNDLRAVSDQLFTITDLLVGRLDGSESSGSREYAEDISDGGTLRSAGTVSGCVNRADIAAETNAGGVVGTVSIELSFDREDEWDISAFLSDGAKYLIFAVVRDCENISSVSARKETAGGIVGRMDYGAVIDCRSGGAVTASGDYAGGIAGRCLGTLRGCRARAGISAANYAGGVAGFGRDIYDCLAMPDITRRAEFQGSVAGDSDGTVADNYYAESSVGGVNGFSFEGRAQAIGYDELLEMSGDLELFKTVTVTLLAEGKTVEVLTIPFGGRVEALPEVADKDEKHWKWDDFDNTAIYRSISVDGQYVSPITTIASGEELPLFLAEGEFYEGQTLTVLPFAPDAFLPETPDADVLAAYTLSVGDHGDSLTVRMRTEENGALYVPGADGRAETAPYVRDGSYIVFQLDNGASFAYVRREKSFALPLAVGAGIVLIVVAAALCLLRRKKKKTGA